MALMFLFSKVVSTIMSQTAITTWCSAITRSTTPRRETFDSSQELFRGVFKTGFALEVLEVFSGMTSNLLYV